jgi:hypothetical protein
MRLTRAFGTWPGVLRRRCGLALSAVCVLAAASCADHLPDQDLRIVDAPPVERLSAALLWQDFQSQRERAERNYNGKAVVLVGDVTSVGTDAPGNRYVYFGQTDSHGIRAHLLDDRAAAVLEAARANPRVTLKCFCEGMTSDVILKSCIVQ